MSLDRMLLLLAVPFFLLAGCDSNAAEPGAGLELGFQVTENRWDPARGDVFAAELTLLNRGSAPLEGGWTLYFNFQRDVRPESLPEGVQVTRINGDFQQLTPTADWTPLLAGAARVLPFEGAWPVTKVTDAPAGAYLVWEEGGAAVAVPVRVGGIAPPAGGHPEGRPADQPLIPTPASRFRDNERVTSMAAEAVLPLVPTPLRYAPGAGTVTLDTGWRVVHAAGLESEATWLAEALGDVLASAPTVEAVAGVAAGAGAPRTLTLALGTPSVGGSVRTAGAEAYTLAVGADGIRIVGSDAAGVFYGVQSLRALLPPEALRGRAASVEVPAVLIEDAPRFPYRGLHLDVARNFHPPETVAKLLRLMAFFKLNRFHFHLTDDEGWRLPVAALPELTEVGGRRGHTLDERDRLVPSFGSGPSSEPGASAGSGAYTREEMVELLRLATRLHIQVIPEIDGPGHARAAVKAMEERHRRLLQAGRPEEAAAYLLTDPEDRSVHRSVQGWTDNVMNPCLGSTYRFLEVVTDELRSIWEEAGAELAAVHIGGDEVPRGVWEGSPACGTFLAGDPDVGGAAGLFAHFVDRVSVMLAERGLATAGWEEIALAPGGEGSGAAAKVPNAALLDRGLVPYFWNNVWRGGAEDLGYRLANAGYPVVLANATNLYFDLAYDRDPLEPGFTWAGLTDARSAYEFAPLDLYSSAREDLAGRPIDPDVEFRGRVRPTAEGARNILGIQGQLWSENATSRERLEYFAFPKLLGLAERAWAAEGAWERISDRTARDAVLERAWSEFAHRLGARELPRLDALEGGVAYRLPPPGAVIRDGMLHVNVPFPGMAIHYTVDGSEPVATSPRYRGPVPVGGSGDVRVRVLDTRGRGGRETRLPVGG